MAAHFGTSILPARPAHPRDKAKVEVAVQVVQRWILARLRNQVFFSPDELNARIAELVEELNDREMRVYGQSRRALFERIDRPALRPLPAERFVYGEWRVAKVKSTTTATSSVSNRLAASAGARSTVGPRSWSTDLCRRHLRPHPPQRPPARAKGSLSSKGGLRQD